MHCTSGPAGAGQEGSRNWASLEQLWLSSWWYSTTATLERMWVAKSLARLWGYPQPLLPFQPFQLSSCDPRQSRPPGALIPIEKAIQEWRLPSVASHFPSALCQSRTSLPGCPLRIYYGTSDLPTTCTTSLPPPRFCKSCIPTPHPPSLLPGIYSWSPAWDRVRMFSTTLPQPFPAHLHRLLPSCHHAMQPAFGTRFLRGSTDVNLSRSLNLAQELATGRLCTSCLQSAATTASFKTHARDPSFRTNNTKGLYFQACGAFN